MMLCTGTQSHGRRHCRAGHAGDGEAKNAGQRLDQFQRVVEKNRQDFPEEFKNTTDESYAEIVNLISERIRRERNTAAHYGPDSNPEEEVDALVRQGMWTLTELWKYRQVLLDLDTPVPE